LPLNWTDRRPRQRSKRWKGVERWLVDGRQKGGCKTKGVLP
jgi:hypothetical protein